MPPLALEILRAPDGKYDWSIDLVGNVAECGREDTYAEALAAAARVVEGETE